MARRPRRGAAAVLALAVFLAACSSPSPSGTARSELVMGIVGDPVSILDDPAASAVAALVFEPLVRRSATEELEARLAESVPTTLNGGVVIEGEGRASHLVATFRIREGARWHDGAPVRGEDVRYAFEQDRVAPEGSPARAMAERVESIDLLDERTVRVAYRAGERWDLYALAPRALPRHLLGDEAAREAYRRRPVHAGPYRIAERDAGRIILVPFAQHVIRPPEIERIIVRTFQDRTALLSALGRNVIDLAPSPSLDADLARTLDRTFDGSALQVLYTPAQSVVMLRLGGAFSEPAVRQAIALAVDRDRITRSVFAGRVRAPASYLVPPLWAAVDLGAPRARDPSGSRALLARAGYRRGTFGIAERDGAQLVGTILYPRSSAAFEDVARGIAVDLASLGVAVDVSPRDLADIEDRVRRGDFEMAVLPEAAGDPLAATERYRGLLTGWADVLADAAKGAAGRAEQRLLYEQLQRMWPVGAPAVPLYQALKVDVVPARLQGARPAAHSAPITWNVSDWRIAPGP